VADIVAFVSHYSSGAATDFHRFPFNRIEKHAKNLNLGYKYNETKIKTQGNFTLTLLPLHRFPRLEFLQATALPGMKDQ